MANHSISRCCHWLGNGSGAGRTVTQRPGASWNAATKSPSTRPAGAKPNRPCATGAGNTQPVLNDAAGIGRGDPTGAIAAGEGGGVVAAVVAAASVAEGALG